MRKAHTVEAFEALVAKRSGLRSKTAAFVVLSALLGSRAGYAEPSAVCASPPRVVKASPRGANAASAPQPSAPPPPACFAPPPPDRTCLGGRKLCDADLYVARIAWRYFENNYNPSTGLVNAADAYPSTTMWDVASSLVGTLAARELELIPNKEFDDHVMALMKTLMSIPLYKGELPNKAYNVETGAMSDYNNKPSEGIGFSALDLGRLASALNILGCMHPKYANAARRVLERWTYTRMIKDGQMFGVEVNPASKKEQVVQEGRLGYEQYVGKIWSMLGFDQHVSANYKNPSATATLIEGVSIAYDSRDPRKFGAYNYVVTESYALDAMENGLDAENTQLVKNIYEVQKKRWQSTKIVTAVSEDNVDRAPYFVYNTIFAAGSPWNAITDTGVDQSELRSVSTKAAFSLFTLFPNDPYSGVLAGQIASAYDEKRGWYSGVYESGIGYNKAITVNTNGILLEALLYKTFGSLNALCTKCGQSLKITAPKISSCNACTASR